MELKSVVPWGRSLLEYKKMFSLSESDLHQNILGCGDGPASFNAESTVLGNHVVSVDPIYQFSGDQIRARINDVYTEVMEQMLQNKNSYVWGNIGSIDELGKVRMEAMETFLGDYEARKESGKYINGALPELPFKNKEFDLALCSHYLFLYSDHINKEQHIASMKELCRVAKEVRVYPLLSLDGGKSKYLNDVMTELTNSGITVTLKSVEYEFQKGATEMLVVKCV